MSFVHTLRHDDRTLTWTVDLDAAARSHEWAQRQPERLAREVGEMAEHFPHWILALGEPDGEHLCACPQCGALVVPREGAWRCAACRRSVTPPRNSLLAWAGHLPALWPPHPRLRAGPPAGHALVTVREQRFLLVPLSVFYPHDWPRNQPTVRYAPGLVAFLRIQPTGRVHLYDAQRPCLYYGNQWNGVSVRAVLQQRVVNHLASLVKIAMGVEPEEAFIGKIHDREWREMKG
jgi:predicted RNA-binding Zn-ribbon protein involved in translation (DUF1610 family)